MGLDAPERPLFLQSSREIGQKRREKRKFVYLSLSSCAGAEESRIELMRPNKFYQACVFGVRVYALWCQENSWGKVNKCKLKDNWQETKKTAAKKFIICNYSLKVIGRIFKCRCEIRNIITEARRNASFFAPKLISTSVDV